MSSGSTNTNLRCKLLECHIVVRIATNDPAGCATKPPAGVSKCPQEVRLPVARRFWLVKKVLAVLGRRAEMHGALQARPVRVSCRRQRRLVCGVRAASTSFVS